MALENITGNLYNAYKHVVPGTILHVDQLMKERQTNHDLCDVGFYTADGVLYFMKDNTPMLAITRESENLVLRHLDEAYVQLVRNHNYYPDQKEAEKAINAKETVIIDLSQLRLSGRDSEWRSLLFETDYYGHKRCNREELKLTQRVYGQGLDFVESMEMYHHAGKKNTTIYVLNPDYVKNYAGDDALGRASWLNPFSDYSSFNAGAHFIDSYCHLRGVYRRPKQINIKPLSLEKSH